jgi:hypothetical protein
VTGRFGVPAVGILCCTVPAWFQHVPLPRREPGATQRSQDILKVIASVRTSLRRGLAPAGWAKCIARET